jgi:shikimate kinase
MVSSPDRHIAIVGPMGSGKTALGTLLAEELGRMFLDSDQQILERTGCTGRDLAETYGVPHLHELEREVFFEAIAHTEPVVVAAAASVIEDAKVRDALSRVLCISLEAEPAILAERAAVGGGRRLVTEAEADRLARRTSLFNACADLTIHTDAGTPRDAVDMIVHGPPLRRRPTPR